MHPLALRICLAAALALAGAARAQLPPEFVDRSPAQLAQDAFAGDYGRLLVAEFGRILRTSADDDCLRAKQIEPGALQARGHALLVRSGTTMLEFHAGAFDTGKFEAALQAGAGRNAKAEYLQLIRDPEVKKFTALNEPARLARIADSVVDVVDRHAIQARFRMTRRLWPLASGDALLLEAHPGEKTRLAAERFAQESKSPQVKRWVVLQNAVIEAIGQSRRSEALEKLGAVKLTPNVARDLTDLCVPLRPKG